MMGRRVPCLALLVVLSACATTPSTPELSSSVPAGAAWLIGKWEGSQGVGELFSGGN